jgi:REP element-mobilizing transposase RayT
VAKPMVIGYHLIWTAYGCWLPNDPRGSTSHTVACDIIAELGPLHYGRKEVQPGRRTVEAFYDRAREVLKFPVQLLTTDEIDIVGHAIGEAIAEYRYTCYACAVLPDHVHMVIRKHRHKAEEMVNFMQESTRNRLIVLGKRSLDHPVWSTGGWEGFLDSPRAVRARIGYIERNPGKHGLGRQVWAFVKEYDDWPFHPGHSPNSPYERRLRGGG